MKKTRSINRLAITLFAAGLGITGFLASGDEAELPAGVIRNPMAVEITEAKSDTVRLDIPAWGLIEPCEQIDIIPQVSGLITEVTEGLVTGTTVNKGDILFTIDPRDYQNALDEATAAYAQTQQSLEIEKGQQRIAKAEYKLLQQSYESSGIDRALALRKPQLKEREAAVAIAKSRKEQALLNLERTKIIAPCDGQITNENVAVGQYVDTNSAPLSVACTETYHVKALFPPQYNVDPHQKEAVLHIGNKEYSGIIKAVLPQIDPNVRQKQALIEIENAATSIGAYAQVTLPGKAFESVITLPKTALRADNTVWILTPESTLDIRSVTLAAQNENKMLVQDGLKIGERVILSHIAMPLKGMALRIQNSEDQNS
jgi:RND family efflux transporter MFP subunit